LSTQSIVDFHQSARAALLGDPVERDQMPDSREQIEQLHLLIAGAPDEPAGVNRFVTSDFRNARLLLRVSDVGAKAQLKLAKRLEDRLDEAFGEVATVDYRLTGDAYVASVALDSFIRDLFYSLLVAFGIIFVMMTFVFRSLKLGLISMLPNTIPLVLTFGYMGLMGINLNTTTIIIFAISLGLAVDDTIHFLARFREEIDRRDTAKEAILYTYYGAGRAILLTSVLLVTGLAVLLLSDFVPTRQFGILTSITIGGAVFGDLILLPSLLYLLYRSDDERAAAG
jgi:predicted RND superfamily exporter protein